MTTAQVVETSVTVNNNSPNQDYVHPDDQTQPTFEMTPGLKPFTIKYIEEPHKGQATHLQSKQEQMVKKLFFKKLIYSKTLILSSNFTAPFYAQL